MVRMAGLVTYLDKYRPNYPDLVSQFPSVGETDRSGAIFRLSRIP